MKLYTDKISGDEMFSDGYDFKEIDDVVYEVDAANIVVQEGDVDIGANPSAEEQQEALENGGQQVINIVHSFRLQSTTFDKKSYLTYLKGYMKAIKTQLQSTDPARVEIFEKKAQEFAKKVLGNFKDYDFYTGESGNPDGMVALLNFREDGVTPFLIFWKDGLKDVKI
ncbi:putative translationally-controlled tumor protein [Meira miltonrushii]|uniref:Translationally-controlled tumor protein homolog n=1 Tax=Meira miltonrushii TaxID=1280837 RepID=A0A316VNY0_9BASI|nr:putative translationally-controlled tumor protein [Meira miltonrushii]PWN37225.1 putative translationally-controlled tumor protein [Meira miltonrushii]